MEEVMFGFYERDIALIADSLSRILGIHLFLQQSPMHGPWYSLQSWQDMDTGLQAIKKAMEQNDFEAAAKLNRAAMTQPDFELRLNDPDPYYCPVFPDEEVHCILRIRQSRDVLIGTEDRLRASGLKYVELKTEPVEK